MEYIFLDKFKQAYNVAVRKGYGCWQVWVDGSVEKALKDESAAVEWAHEAYPPHTI